MNMFNAHIKRQGREIKIKTKTIIITSKKNFKFTKFSSYLYSMHIVVLKSRVCNFNINPNIYDVHDYCNRFSIHYNLLSLLAEALIG